MASKRILPLEVQALIFSHLSPSFRTRAAPFFSRAVVSSSPRFSSTTSLASHDLFPSGPSTSSSVQASTASPAAQASEASVFEDASDEYLNVPLSTLDHPPVPRTSDELLISLLQVRQRTEALDLLRSLQASGQAVPPRFFFARYAHKVAKRDVTDPTWLEWWKLAPGVTDEMHPEVGNVRKAVNDTSKAAGRVVQLLLQARRDGVDMGGKDAGFERLAEFALVLAQQGHTRVVADLVLPHIAAYGPVELSEQLFSATLAALQRQQGEFVVQGQLARRSRGPRRRMRAMALSRRTAQVATQRLLVKRSVALQGWFNERTKDGYAALLAARGKMISAHAALGRLDLAVLLVLETQQAAGFAPGSRLKLDRALLLTLLDRTGRMNRFDLFEPLYESLAQQGRRLVRVNKKELRLQTPYFIRSAKYRPLVRPAPPPSAKEAYLTFRDRLVISSIEEGPLAAQGASFLGGAEELHGAEGEAEHAFGEPPSAAQVDELKAAIKLGDFDRSSAMMAQLLSRNAFPPAPVAASWIAAAAAEEGQRGAEVLQQVEELAHATGQGSGYWTTARMLAHVRAGEYVAALLAFREHYDLSSLPDELRAASNDATRDARRVKANAVKDKRPPSSYTLAVFLQALVPQLEQRAASSGSTAAASRVEGHLKAAYRSLVPSAASSPPAAAEPASSRLSVIPSLINLAAFFERFASFSSSSPALDATPPALLSPYTFTPFLLHHLRLRSSPLALLNILADMTRLHIQPEQPHYAIVLNSFARLGDSPSATHAPNGSRSGDVLFLLDCFARRSTSSVLAGRASDAVVKLVESGGVALPAGEELNAKVYTGVLAGLQKRGEVATAMAVLEQVARERTEEVQRWGREDERFRREVVRLTKKAGITRAKEDA
ncbi:hypothetical protein JCM10213_006309 [Rhodosporidiobolus nylandii]